VEDNDIRHTIAALVDEERRLRSGSPSDEEHARLREIEEHLDQCWDLLRQRDALRDAHLNPGEAKARPVGEVEGYLQ
jgi:hypothetical protein